MDIVRYPHYFCFLRGGSGGGGGVFSLHVCASELQLVDLQKGGMRQTPWTSRKVGSCYEGGPTSVPVLAAAASGEPS